MRHINLTKQIIQLLKESDKPLSTHEIQDSIPHRQRQSMNVLGNILSKNPDIRKVGMIDSEGLLGRYRIAIWTHSGLPDHKIKTTKRYRFWQCRKCNHISIKLTTRRHQQLCELCNCKNHTVHAYIW